MNTEIIYGEYKAHLPGDLRGQWNFCVVGSDAYTFANEVTEQYEAATIWWMEDPMQFDDTYRDKMDLLILSPQTCISEQLPAMMRLWQQALKQDGSMLCACDYNRFDVLTFLNLCQKCGYYDVTPKENAVYTMKRPPDDPDFLPQTRSYLKQAYREVYVLCPALYRSGGPEVLHQLVHCINVLGGKASIAYVWTEDKEVFGNPDLIHYVAGHIVRVEDIPDEQNVAVVAPEIFVEYLAVYENADVYLWWLSADNFVSTYPVESMDMIWRYIRQCVPHNLYQSVYAKEYCLHNGVGLNTLAPLSDYISAQYLVGDHLEPSRREKRILYSPKRGLEFTKKLIEAAPDLCWTPIERMSASQVFDLMCHSMVYIDFGTHPGKDRLPREAAMCGCCVITGRRGSAAYSEDVAIREEYKFSENTEDIPQIVDTIRSCLIGFEEKQDLFDAYRKCIRGEKAIFRNSVENLFFMKNQAQ